MKVYNAKVSSPVVANRHPYVYILYTVVSNDAFLYIGETEDKNGAIGRLTGHLNIDPPGTFLAKIMNSSVYGIVDVNEVNMLAFDVSDYDIFTGDMNRTKRRALEYLVHFEMLKYSCTDEVTIPYTVVSHVQAQPRFILDDTIRKISEDITKQAIQLIPFNK